MGFNSGFKGLTCQDKFNTSKVFSDLKIRFFIFNANINAHVLFSELNVIQTYISVLIRNMHGYLQGVL